ncbi:MAG: tetraacyldisaccharide 4'-kinase [Candidatus Binatia bacterium]
MLMIPSFWQRDGIFPRLLSPLSALTTKMTSLRISQPTWQAPIPVICCGGLTVGGAGKTPLTLALASHFIARNISVHILSRGFGGRARSPKRVCPDDSVLVVGDEPLLLAQVAPTWIGGNRAETARRAVAAGAEALLMDDGLQNPTLSKDLSLLVINGETGLGNGRVLPAGPLREPVAAGTARCQAAVIVTGTGVIAPADLPVNLPTAEARLVQDSIIRIVEGQPVVAFAGLAIPSKFFKALSRANPSHLETRAFRDHHMFTRREIDALAARATDLGGLLVTTPKDAVRIPVDLRVNLTVIGLRLVWTDALWIESLLRNVCGHLYSRQHIRTLSAADFRGLIPEKSVQESGAGKQ